MRARPATMLVQQARRRRGAVGQAAADGVDREADRHGAAVGARGGGRGRRIGSAAAVPAAGERRGQHQHDDAAPHGYLRAAAKRAAISSMSASVITVDSEHSPFVATSTPAW